MGHNKKKNKNRNKKKNRRSNDNPQEDKSDHVEHEANETEVVLDNVFKSGSTKRQHEDNDNDSENEELPRKKKKKKQQVETATTDKKGKKSIRQMKREKFAERQAEAQAIAKDQLKSQCLNYLSQWKHDKANWKFMKAKQVWLYKNKFSATLLPDSSWPLLLEYFESAQGNIRKMLLEDASKIIKQMDEWTESQSDPLTAETVNEEDNNYNDNSDEAPKSKKPDEIVYKRARDLIQCLEE
ncbi:unnamed protein product [Arctia plantaginis]|nr:unnamed protein product [Arctia plantaginis]